MASTGKVFQDAEFPSTAEAHFSAHNPLCGAVVWPGGGGPTGRISTGTAMGCRGGNYWMVSHQPACQNSFSGSTRPNPVCSI